ncbi:uncharacterized protein MONBRDRAFT_34013 [Monosiga brevicollis MX1]|uniref:Essential protein Yae1 N-terminal domain-containing protein n=1 Tax=Monosiga brevicollis TaxID=81824 RepID=A9V940_MONBE|nr:uncharacterized protein MONBRDRAFT_34013 [Monosiga brevicollis MX1]EDQ85988.1 predicted protein [Monosiga brevicollis MX1]|eukprot:XP_001749182.1 hypothetical protein [Monosiga brevicollis MX1]
MAAPVSTTPERMNEKADQREVTDMDIDLDRMANLRLQSQYSALDVTAVANGDHADDAFDPFAAVAFGSAQDDVQAGHTAGWRDGQRQGLADGFLTGSKTAFDLFKEMGYYRGCCQFFAAAYAPLAAPSRRALSRLETLLDEADAVTNVAQLEPEATIRTLRQAYKVLCVTLKVEQPYTFEPTQSQLSF